KLSTLLRPMFINLDSNWTSLLPAADSGATRAPADVPVHLTVDDALQEQRSAWAIWLTPRPARVKYGIDLTRGLFRHMRDLGRLQGVDFEVLLTPVAARDPGPVALEHAGHWFVADPAARDAAVADITRGFDTISLPVEGGQARSPDAERAVMGRL